MSHNIHSFALLLGTGSQAEFFHFFVVGFFFINRHAPLALLPAHRLRGSVKQSAFQSNESFICQKEHNIWKDLWKYPHISQSANLFKQVQLISKIEVLIFWHFCMLSLPCQCPLCFASGKYSHLAVLTLSAEHWGTPQPFSPVKHSAWDLPGEYHVI